MGFISELKRISSKQQSSSKTSKEDKLKSKNGVGSAICGDLNYRAQQVADRKSHNHEKVKGNAGRKDELVKHMTNLPGYLWSTDGEENVRGKALNVGVLDWTRLEKWNHKQTNVPAFGTNFTSFSVRESTSRVFPKSFASAGLNDKLVNQRGFLSSSTKASYKGGFPENSKQPFQNVKQSHYSKSEAESVTDEQGVVPPTYESFRRNHIELSFEKVKRKHSDKMTLQMGYLASNLRHQGFSQVPNGNMNVGADKSLEGLQDSRLKKNSKIRESTSGMGLASLKPKGEGVSCHSKKKTSVCNSEVKKAAEKPSESDINTGHKPCYDKPSNVVLLHPQEIIQSSNPRVHQPRMPFDENVKESSQGGPSDVSLIDDVYSEYVNFEIPHSCPLPCVVEPAPTAKFEQHKSNVDRDSSHSTTGSKKMYSLQFEGAYDEKNALDDKLGNHCVHDDSNKSGDLETAEQTAPKGRTPSPNRRFSFSLGRIGRSFSFKEGSGSSLPQFRSTYVSVKSGPVTSESSDCLDNSSKEKVRSHRRTGSSPFRRILEPLLKQKSTEMHHSAQRSQATKGTIGPINFKTNSVKESISHAEKSEGSSIQALLHLTIKNGVPIFKFVLNNERKILAATIKKSASPERDDSGCFTFYLVDEIKKKSGGWISNRSKDKSSRYVHNVVGQMKSLSSTAAKPSNKSSKTQCFVKEFVLLSVEIGQKDQITPKFIPSQELAAVVVEIPCGNVSQGADHDINFLTNECLKCLAEDSCSCSSKENDVSSRTTVILPGGIHGSPSKGEPSPLIYRWKTGGLCDCGGWDIGCKLLVLSNQKERSIITRGSKSHPRRFQLFVQEGAEQNRPLFTLMPLKDGFFSVEFSSSITHLQAFFISVSLLSCQKEIALEINKTHEASKQLSSKNNDGLQQKEHIKYTPIPPLSPVGRV
ncbi:uncharacterized protein LOC114711731 [Neltuma alba]|uniref:uncharacterized protein LOC114711731 n=1 Tax=Neltuma alba TaxID=207710 RepID=UPI0010A49C5E|nr:uncharacterized protein LOC114711731 [Prosopis alba]